MAKGAIASLLVSIGADTSELEAGGRRASKSMDDLGEKAKALGGKMAALGAAAAAAGAVLAASMVKTGLDAIDAQAKLARALDTTIDGLRGLQLAAGDAGVSNEDLTGVLRTLNQRVGEAQRGVGTAAKAFDTLGISASAFSQLDSDQKMASIADRVKELGMSSSQTADLLKQLGIRGNENLIAMMRAGGDAIRAARKDVDDFGLSMSKVDAAKVEAANDSMQKIGRVFESIRNKITVAIAPILGELADRFNALAKENKGFGDQAVQSAEAMARGFAKVLDVFRGLHVVLKGLQLVAEGFAASFYSALELVMNAVTSVTDVIAKEINQTIRWVNALGANLSEIPLMSESQWAKDFRAFADGSRDRVGRVREELHDLAMEEMPSDKIEKFFAAVKQRAQEAAEATAASDLGGGTFVSTDEEEEKRKKQLEKELERQREALQAKLNQVLQFASSERDLELARHAERLETLQAALAAELIVQEEHDAAVQALEEGHMKRLAEIRLKGMTDLQKFTSASFDKQAKAVSGHLADITAGVARENKAMFQVNKVAGIANAIVHAYEGISLTMSKYPYPINIGLAAAHAAAAFAQVNAIKNQSFSSGAAAAPSLAGGTPATPVTPVNGGTPASAGGGSVLTIENLDPEAIFSGRVVRAFAERLQDHFRDGGVVQFA